jgi:LSD1 subclass zinc finger protein
MKIHCPGCAKPLEVPDGCVGRRARCAYCNQKFVIADPKAMMDETIASWMLEDTSKVQELKRRTQSLLDNQMVTRPVSPGMPASRPAGV